MSSTVEEDAIKIVSVINRHVDEDPECKHSLKEIVREIFD